MNKAQITMLDENSLMSLDSNYISNLLQYSYMQHERFGDGQAMSLQILLELQALIVVEIEEVKNNIINNELGQLWTSGQCVNMDAGGRPPEE